MLANICSWSRITGVSKNGKNYDSFVLHCSFPRNTVDSSKCRITGYPVQFRDVSIPVSNWAIITHLDFKSPSDVEDFLTDRVGESVELSYNISTYNGVDRAFIEHVSFGGDNNA